MKSLLKILFLCLAFPLSAFSQEGNFNFTLPSSATTSAGVFREDGTLIKTLWNCLPYDAGTHTEFWDGTDDLGQKIESPDKTYQIKILRNRVQYTWQGTIGNTSSHMTGPAKHTRVYTCMEGLAFTDNHGYFCAGYCEGFPSIGKFLIAKPQEEIRIFTDRPSCVDTKYVATDGVTVYWGASDVGVHSTNTFVYATRVSDDQEVAFEAGQPYKLFFGREWNTVSYLNERKSKISGLAVQKNGRFLFVARSGLNQLQVLDKKSGALVQTLAFDQARALCVDSADDLWLASGASAVDRYKVGPEGKLSQSTLTLPGLLSPLAVQVSPDGRTVSVADGDKSQQVKFFDASTGKAAGTLGEPGGYSTHAAVSDTKFYFVDPRDNRYNRPFIAYQPDGTFWVNDPGNFRVQHYKTDLTWIDRIMAMGCTYSVFADKNNINRIFSDFLEFEVDYSVQNLSGSAGWKLKNNWGGAVPANYVRSPKDIITLSNGKTYGLLRVSGEKVQAAELIEFEASGRLRFTGLRFKWSFDVLCSDGSLQKCDFQDSKIIYKRYPLTGFDANGNPLWSGTAEVLATALRDKAAGNPATNPVSQIFSTNDKIGLYNYHAWADPITKTMFSGYHLGVMRKGADNTYLFQTEKSTHKNYRGPYPGIGYFDVGNNVNDYAGANINMIDRNIITSYHGEFWKNSQTNKFNHYYDDGLGIGQFGTTRPDGGMRSIAAPMMAGNALTPTAVKDANGDIYLWHGDECDHAGVHRWKISGLDSIAEEVISLPYPSAYRAPALDHVDLLAKLPFDESLRNNTSGWTRFPADDDLTDQYKSYFKVWTSTQQENKTRGNDVFVRYVQKMKGESWVSRDLGVNEVKAAWKVAGLLAYPGNNPNGGSISQVLEVLDDEGKVLASLLPLRKPGDKETTLMANGQVLTTDSGRPLLKMDEPTPFFIAAKGGQITISYGDYQPLTTNLSDAAGNWRKPKSLRLRFEHNGTTVPAYAATVDLGGLKFYKD